MINNIKETVLNNDAFFIYDEPKFNQNINNLKKAFNYYFDNLIIGYSYKTNYLPQICECAHKNDLYAEVVSDMELDFAYQNLNDKSNLIYNGPIKNENSLRKVVENNGIINIDDEYDYQLLNSIPLKKNKPIKIFLRINIDYKGQKSRFGMDLPSLKKIYNKILLNTKFNFLGLHVHLPFRSLESFRYRSIKIVSILEELNIKNIDFINVGGGFYGELTSKTSKLLNIDNPPLYKDYAKTIYSVFKKFTKKYNTKLPGIIIEPGTSIIADSMKFVSNVKKVKKIKNHNIIVCLSAMHLLSPTNKKINLPVDLYDKNCKLKNYNDGYKYLVSGFTCIESDILGEISVKTKIDNSHFLVFNNVGSYSIVMGSNFILPQPAIFKFDGNSFINISTKIDHFNFYNKFKLNK